MEGGNNLNDPSPTGIGLSPQLSPSSQFNGNSQRRKLTKKPPPSSHHHSSSYSIDGRIDAQSIQSKRSSTSLKRAPSAPAPVARNTPTSNAPSNSSPRYPPSATASTRLQNPSPLLQNNEFVAQPTHHTAQGTGIGPSQSFLQHQLHHPHPHPAARMKDRHSESNSNSASQSHHNSTSNRPLSSKTSEELIGAPFDGGAILNRIEATKSPLAPAVPRLNTNHYAPYRPAPPAPSYTSPDTRTMAQPPSLRQSASFSAADSAADTLVNEKSFSSRVDTSSGSSIAPKRYSDESREPKMPGLLRKKTGISGFMSSLVGSPKKPLISAPENPVHVTHVGYDSQTGQFTVSIR